MSQMKADPPTLAVPEALSVVERKQLTTFLAAAQGHFQGTDAALQEFEVKLKTLQRLPDEWKLIEKELHDLKLSIHRNEENSSALLTAANHAHQAAIVAGGQIAVLTERIQSLDIQVKRHSQDIEAHGTRIEEKLETTSSRLESRALIGILLGTVAILALMLTAITLGKDFSQLLRGNEAAPQNPQTTVIQPRER